MRVLAFVLAIAVAGLAVALTPSAPAQAAVVQWGTNNGQDPNYQATVNGDFIVAGNGVLACASVPVTGAGTCADLHAATSANGQSANDNASMQNANTVPGFTTNSSSASVTIPSGATVTKAYLQWSANTGVYQGDGRALCAQYSAQRGTATLPSGSATGYQTQSTQLRVGSNPITAYDPDTVLQDASSTNAIYYSATADVTPSFAGAASGSALTVSAGNIWAPTGAGCYAGWSLTLVYDYGTYVVGNPSSVPRRVIYYYGHVRENATDQPLTVPFTGFTAVGTGTRLGYSLYEGDRVIAGDTATYSRDGGATYAEIPNSAGATGNIGIGRAAGSVRYTQTQDTSTFTNQSVDVAAAPLGNVTAGDSTVNLRVGTSGDSYLLTSAVLSVPTAGLQVKKTYDGSADIQYRTNAEKATFTITLTNTGAGTLQNIQVTDDQADCSRALTGVTLAPLQSTTITCTATANTTAGYTTTATATARTVLGNYLASGSDSTTVALSSLALTKTSALAPGATGRAGDVLTYTFTATNNGQGTRTGVAITDPLPNLSALAYGTWPSGTAGTLNAGQSVTATATYTLTQADVDAGSVVNTATTTGTDADGGLKPTASATRTTPITSSPALTLAKTGMLPNGATGKVGDVITYGFTATNSGNVTLTGVAISDPRLGGSAVPVPAGNWPGTVGRLAPGQSVSTSATYTITQADVDAGSARNTATVTGKSPANVTVTATSSQVTVATAAAAPTITTTKSGAYTTGSGAVGSVITYSFSARNTGNVTLTGVAIADPHPGLSALSYSWPGTSGTLAPGQTVTATATDTVTQADVDAGTIRNTATSTGTSPTGTVVTNAASATLAPTAAAPAVTLTKSGTASGTTVGSTVTYTFTLRNTGNVTLTGAGIADPLVGLSPIAIASWPSGTAGKLNVGDTVTGTATYTLKQSDVDAGSVVNTATATATPPSGANVTQSRSATVVIPPTGAVTVTKSGTYTSGSGAVGSVIRWDIAFTNSGNVTLTQVALADSLPGLSTPTITWPGTAGTLTPGQRATATATYTLTQADVDAGVVRNTATVSARTPGGAAVSGSSPQASVTTAAAAPGLSLTKSGAIAGGAAGNAGDVITYTFTLRNTGNVTLTGAGVADPLAGLGALTYTWPGTAGTLAPGQTATATASYTIKQSDVDTGNVKNTASATATTPAGGTATATSGQVTTPTATAAPAITTTKAGALATGATGVAGDTVNWTITLRNSGNQTLTSVSASDSLASISTLTYTWPGTAGTLAPGQTATARGTSTLTQADVDAGSVANIATGAGTSPVGTRVQSTGPATVPVAARGALTLTKTPSVTTGAQAGDTVTYTFVLRNAGNVTLTGVTVTDPLSGLSAISYGPWSSGTTGRLLPGATETATATYVVKQADVDRGSFANTATGNGTTPSGAAVTPATASATVTTVAAAPAIAATKTAAYTTGSGAVGSVLTYTFTARNTGNVTLTGVAIADPLPNLGQLTFTWPGTSGVLAPNQTVTARATYTVTQADVDRGSVVNRATASGTSPAGTTVSGQSSLVTTSTAASAPALAFTKSGSAAGTTAGSVVTYTFTLRNAGNVTLTGAGITDPLPGLSAITVPAASWPSGTVGRLNVGDSVTGSASYTLTQSDVDAGSVSNTATATATPPSGAAVSTTSSATVPVAGTGALAVTKSGAYTSGSGAVGSVVRWTIGIRNSGNVTLTGVSATDTLAGLGALSYTWPGTAGTLAPGQSATAIATYTVTQADVDAGGVRNTATATGRTPQNALVSGSSPQAAVTTDAAAPALVLAKSGTILGGAAGNAGDVIQYTFTLRNTGNVTVTGAAVADPLAGLGPLTYAWPGTAGTLAPGRSATATARYTITQADVNSGSVRNTATASATPPGGGSVTASSGQVTTVTAAAAPAIVVTKSGALATGATGVAGDTVNWSFTLRNTGNQTLTGAAITDSLTGISTLAYSWPGAPGTLQPGQTATATATYVLTQTDVDAGAVANTATGQATTPANGSVTSTAPATVSVTAKPSLSLTKTPSITSGARAGDTITYTFVGRNTGNVTLNAVAVDDPLVGLSARTYTWPGAAGRLAPGQSVTATASYVVTQADVDAGSVKNTASITGTPPTGAAVTASSGQVTVTTVAAGPAISATKSAAYTTGSGAVGSVLTYSFSAQNTGNVTLTGVTISDQLTGLSALSYAWPGTAGRLAPGQTVTATATYTLTQADLDRGAVVNRATASGTAPGGTTVSGQSSQVTTNTAPQVGSTSFSKTGTASGTSAGSTVTYTFTVQNTGNITLRNVTITDPLPGLSPISVATWPSGTPGQLSPGDTVTATATYQLTQTDVDAGAVSNTATVAGTRPNGATGSRTASATVPLAAGGALAVTKSSAYQSGSGAVGSVIRYTFGLRNTGNVTLTGVAVVDPLAGLSTVAYTWPGTPGTLAPDQTASGTATYTVTQADVDRGSVGNTATASGRTPGGTAVTSSPASATTPTATAAPAILTLKSATVSGTGAVGDRILYTITAQNTGNVTLTGVTISDPMFTTAQIRYGAWPSGTTGTLRPGDVVSATAIRVITQADVDAGRVVNTSSSSGTSPGGTTVTDPSDQVTTSTAARAPQISLTQTGALPTGSTGVAGDTVTWSFTITNTGNTTLTQVMVTPGLTGVSQPVYGTWPVAAGTLAPGQSVTATATSTLTQAQVDAGSVTDPATASGLASDGTTTVTASKPATVSYSPAATLGITKSGGITSGTGGVGSIVTYRFTATNTGATTLTGVAIADPHAGLSPLTYSWPNAPNVLAPGQTVTATATYAITQADVDRGSTTNTATASATSPQGATVGVTSNQVTVGTGAQPPGLSLSKSAAYFSGSGAVGSVLRYTFTATNTGSLTLSGVSVVDPLPNLGPMTPSAPVDLAPGESATVTADYTVRQADVDRGYVQNTASASATYNGGASTIGAQSNTLRTATATATPTLTLTKTGSVPPGTTAVGTQASFAFTVRNTGNVTMSGVAITDQLAGIGPITYGAFPTTPGTLAPGESVTATAGYAVTQADIDAGAIVNTATATGTSPTGADVSAPGAATVPLATTSELTVTKSARLNGSGVAGDTIDYSFVVRNSGTTTLRGVTVDDALPGLGAITYGTWPSGASGQLDAGQQVTAAARYTLTQADVDAGSVVNQARARATKPDGTAITPALSDPVTTTPATAAPRLQVTKTPSVTTGAKAGDTIRYAVTIANTGNVTVSGITVTDGLPAVTDLAVTWPGAGGVLAPGQSATGTASYTVRQSDVDSGSVLNTVSAAGSGTRGGNVSATDSATTTTQTPAPAIAVTDAGRLASGSSGRAGDTAQFTYVLTNTGNVTLTSVTATEALPGATAPSYGTWPGGVADQLAPGQSVTVTTSYVLTQADVDAKTVRSDVTARGTGPAPASTAVTATATASVPIASAPALSAVKSGSIVSPGIGQVGDTIRYRLVTTNTGNVTLYQGSLVDPLPGLRITSIDWPDNGDPGTLPPGTSVTGIGEYAITQADVNLGYIQNTAQVAAFTTRTGQDPANLVSADSNTVQIATVQAAPALSIRKTSELPGGGALNDTVDWTVTVTNTGNVTVSGVQFTDSLALQNVTVSPAGNPTLDPGGVATLRGSTTIGQADVDAGAVTNVASASGTPVRGAASVTAGPVSATVRTTTQMPDIAVTKSAALATGSTGVAGDLVDFSYTVSNPGNTTLTGIALDDGGSTIAPVAFGTWPGTPGTLLPGQSVTATAQHRLTQAEVDAGGQSTAVTATGTPPPSTGVGQVSATATAAVTVGARPSMAVTKNGTVNGSGGVGSSIAYRFTITNTGNVTLSLVDLVDSLPGVSMPVISWPGQTGILKPGEQATATADYAITQGDVDRGTVGNTATASGKPPVGDTIYVSSPLTTTAVADAAPAISVVKSASPSSGLRVGDTVTYTITGTNTGNVTLTGVSASDPLPGIGTLTPSWPGPAGQLAPTQAVTYTATYRVTQADVDAGSVTNTATVTGTGARGGAVSGTASATSTVAVAGPSIRVTDSGALEPGSTGSPDDVVTWSYVVTNTGDVTLRTVTLAEAQNGASPPVFATGFTGTLAPGQSVTATSTYRLTQADIDSGSVSSSVSTSGLPPTGAAVSSTAAATVTIPRTASYTVVKRAQLIDGPAGRVGERIRYFLDVQNTGNVTLYRGTLLDPLPGLGTQFPSWPDPAKPGQLAPGTGATGYADYPIMQADVDRGYLDNVASVAFYTTATGNATDNRVDVPSNPVRVNLAQAVPQLSITKRGVPSEGVRVGDRITWTIDVRNTGNVTVKAVRITDDDPLTITSGTTTPGDLAPGQTATLVGTSPITQTELDAGRATNTARAAGSSARDNAPVASGDITAVVTTVAAANALDLVKTASQGPGWSNRAGDTVAFGYSVTNTGNTTLTGVQVADALPLTGPITYTWPGTPGRLAPGETATATASYRVTQADVDAGTAGGPATATGAGRGGTATDTDTASVPITAAPDLRVTKDGTVRGSGGPGDVIDYDFTIENAGNVTLTLVALADSLGGVSNPVITWPRPASPGVLLPGERATATASYTITQADVDRGTVANTATASGKPPVGDTILRSSNASLTTVAPAAPALGVTILADPTTGVTAGSTIGYTIAVRNTGNVTLSNISVTDPLPGLSGFTVSWPGAPGVLVPGQTATVTPSYRATQADIDAGSVTNTVSASGTSPAGATVTDSASATSTAVPARPILTVSDSGALAPGSTGAAGDTVAFTYVVRNTGTVTLRGVALQEALAGATAPAIDAAGWPGATGVLAPGQQAAFTSAYALTQADVDRGSVASRITASGISPAATTPDATAVNTATVAIPQRRGLDAVKTGMITTGTGALGDTVRYDLEVTNTGNVTLYQGRLLDRLPGLQTPVITWPDNADPGTVPPGQKVLGYAYYQLTQADIDRGYLDNTAGVEAFATRTGRDPANRVTDDSNTVRVVTEQAQPELTQTLSAVRNGRGDVGDTITYTIVTTNTGNVTVTGTSVAERPGIPAPTPGTIASLAPGASVTSTTTYTITQADVDAGSVSNTTTASGSSIRDGAPVTTTSTTTVTPTATRAPAIAITDSGALASPDDNRAGGTVTWTYTVTNTGNTTLTAVQVTDALPNVGAPVYRWTGTPGTLARGDAVTATATYTLTQADVDAGSVISSPTASGTPPTGAPATASTTATVSVQAAPQFTITKTAALQTAGRNGVGDEVVFRFTLANPGNTTLRQVTLTDSLAGLTLPEITWPTATDGVLPPGTTATGTATYQIAQKDVDAGSVQNQASATAQPPTGPALTAQSTVARVTTAAPAPAMTLTQTGAALRSGTGTAGSVVRFTFALRNTGNVTLSTLSVADGLAGAGAPVLTLPGGGTTLIPGATGTAYVDYTLTQADVDRGYVDNAGTATATPPSGTPFTVPSNTVRFTTAQPAPALTTTQTGALEAGQTGVLGDTVDYLFTVRNTGNVTLSGVTFQSTVGGLTQLTYTWPTGTAGVVPPGQSAALTATHVVTQADVDLGVIRNVETGRGTSPSGAAVQDAASELVIPLATASTDLTLSKSGVARNGGGVGDTIDYTLTLRNSGTTTLTGASISDGLPGLSTLVYGAWPTGTAGTLPPATQVTATATYLVTQADVDAGSVVNTASASASGPQGGRVTAVSPASTVAAPAAAPRIALAKSLRLAAGATGRVGDLVLYSFDVQNTGTVTLQSVTLSDDQPGITGWTYSWPGTSGVLAPGERLRVTAQYALTQPDIDAGTLSSTATADATGARGGAVSDAETVPLAIAAAPALAVTKTATAPTAPTVGSIIGYAIRVENTGNVTLTGIGVSDPLLPGLVPSWPGVAGALAPGEVATATGTYTVTQADVDAGAVANTATATGTDRAGTTATARGSATVQVPNGAAIALAQSVRIADGQRGYAGDTLVWTYVITNTGSRTLTGVTLADPRPGLSAFAFGPWPSGTTGTLAPGQSVIATATSVITAAQQGTRVVGTSTVSAVGASAAQRVGDDASAAIQLPAVPDPVGRPAPGRQGGLAVTGTDALLPAAGAILLVVWGLLLIGVARLRRRKETE